MRTSALLAGLLGLLSTASPLPAQQPAEPRPEVFMWVGANRLLDDAPPILEDMLRFAMRNGIVPYSSGMAEPERLERFLALCRSLGVPSVWIEIGVPRDLTGGATVEEFVRDPGRRTLVLARYRALGEILQRHYPDSARVTLFDEAPLGAFPGPSGEGSYLREAELFRRHGPAAFALLKEALTEAAPHAEVGLFLHHPHNASPTMAGEHAWLEEFIQRAAAMKQPPDFVFSDVYRGYFHRGFGREATDAYIRDVAAHTRAVADRWGMRAYQLGQVHTIKIGHTPSRREIDGNVDAMLAGGVHGIGWYWPNYAATDQVAPGEPAPAAVSFDPFMPNAWGELGPAGSLYATARDRWAYSYLRALEATGRLDPRERFDLWLYGEDLDHAEHEVALRRADGTWEVIGRASGQRDADGYVGMPEPERLYSGDGRWRVVVFHALERSRFLSDEGGAPRLDVRIRTSAESDGARVAAAYALPYRETRHFTTEAEATREVETWPRALAVDALARHVRPHAFPLAAGGEVVLELGSPTAADLPVETWAPRTAAGAPFREGVATPRPPDALSPAFWRDQGLEDVLAPWTEHGRDRAHGAFHTFLDREWRPYGSSEKHPGMVARHLFSYAAGYLLSGDDAHLERAREVLEWLIRHGWDEEHGGWFDAVSREGRVVRDTKDLFMQLYAVTGLAMYWIATHDPEAMRYIERTLALLDGHAWDPEHGGYVRTLARDLSVLDSAKVASPQLAPVSGYLLYLYLATAESRWLERAQRLTDLALTRMRDPETGWLLGSFTPEWHPSPRAGRPGFQVNTGHNIEVAWSALRLHLLTGEERYREQGVQMAERLGPTRLAAPGAWPLLWSAGFPLHAPDSLDAGAPWWIQAYGNMLSLYLHRVTGETRHLATFERGAHVWNRWFMDPLHGGAVLSVDSGGRIVRGDKAVRTKTSYHSMEHALLLSLYTGLWLTGEPVTLHYGIERPRPGQLLRPVLVEDPAVRIERVEVNGSPWHDFHADEGWIRLHGPAAARVAVTLTGPARRSDEAPAAPREPRSRAGGPGRAPASPKAEAAAAGEAESGPERLLDLVVHGDGLGPNRVRAWLRTNPAEGEEWIGLEPAAAHDSAGGWTLLFTGLEAERFLGQDIRQNHLTVRVEALGGAPTEMNLRAFYALPHAPEAAPAARAAALAHRTREAPRDMEAGSVAATVYPHPRPLRAGEPVGEYIEAPVRGLPPGIMEAEWLEILWRLRQ